MSPGLTDLQPTRRKHGMLWSKINIKNLRNLPLHNAWSLIRNFWNGKWLFAAEVAWHKWTCSLVFLYLVHPYLESEMPEEQTGLRKSKQRQRTDPEERQNPIYSDVENIRVPVDEVISLVHREREYFWKPNSLKQAENRHQLLNFSNYVPKFPDWKSEFPK